MVKNKELHCDSFAMTFTPRGSGSANDEESVVQKIYQETQEFLECQERGETEIVSIQDTMCPAGEGRVFFVRRFDYYVIETPKKAAKRKKKAP